MANITMKELLEAGVHFGHQTKRWNPKMKEYIFGERNGIYIIDLQKTLKMFKEASKFVTELTSQGKLVLFVGTKRQAQDAIAEEANRCGMPYINSRWLGGLLTNWVTVQKSVKRLQELDDMSTDGRYDLLTKKEVIKLERERKHLSTNLSGIKSMKRLRKACRWCRRRHSRLRLRMCSRRKWLRSTLAKKAKRARMQFRSRRLSRLHRPTRQWTTTMSIWRRCLAAIFAKPQWLRSRKKSSPNPRTRPARNTPYFSIRERGGRLQSAPRSFCVR